jgi:hypothetical protein
MAEYGKSAGPDIATLEREGTRLHHCIATEGLGEGKAAKPQKREAQKPDDDAKMKGGGY